MSQGHYKKPGVRLYDVDMERTSALRLAATLDEMPESLNQPNALLHWIYAVDAAPTASLGSDGHPSRDDAASRKQWPRRMFAGARTSIVHRLRFGLVLTVRQSVTNVCQKKGSRGDLLFVTESYVYSQEGRICVKEDRDVVYLESQATAKGDLKYRRPELRQREDCVHSSIRPSETLLFRFSALTFNAHRIHYDREYAVNREGYPERVVHGPLIAMLLEQLVRQSERHPLRKFEFHVLGPAFLGEELRLSMSTRDDGRFDLEASTERGLVMSAKAAAAD